MVAFKIVFHNSSEVDGYDTPHIIGNHLHFSIKGNPTPSLDPKGRILGLC